jgi:hypothetical protein
VVPSHPEAAIDKDDAIAAVLAQLRAELDALERATKLALDEATGDESRAENQYDTRSLESSYLAAGQGKRVMSLRRLVAFFAASPGVTLIGLEGDAPAWYLLAPDGGGMRVLVGGTALALVTPGSPAGQALAGVQPGDEVKLGTREYTVASVA